MSKLLYLLPAGGSAHQSYPIRSASIEAGSIPLAGGDTSGSTGSMTLTIPRPDKYAPETFGSSLSKAGPFSLLGQGVVFGDVAGPMGSDIGVVSGVSVAGSSRATLNLQVKTVLNSINIHNMQTHPFVGTLGDAIREYMHLAGLAPYQVQVHVNLESIQVAFPGWQGELWYHLKMLAMAYKFDIVSVGGVLKFLPLRRVTVERAALTDYNVSHQPGQLAQYVDVVQQNNHAFVNELVYPPGGWTQDTPVLRVNAGEYSEEILDLSASLSTIQQPVMKMFVPKDSAPSESAFTVTGNDGLPITPAAWEARGGFLHVEIGEDTRSLIVKMRGPTGLPSITGGGLTSYGIALSSGSNDGDYSTLRIVGSGVSFLPEVRRIPTGVSEHETASEVGETIDNPFLSSAEQANSIGWLATRKYNGTNISYSMSAAEAEGAVWWDSIPEDHSPLQAVPYIAGARVWDETARRWFRIRNVSSSPEGFSATADDDLTHKDFNDKYGGMTCEEVQEMYEGFTYRQVEMMGLIHERE